MGEGLREKELGQAKKMSVLHLLKFYLISHIDFITIVDVGRNFV